MKLIMIFTLSVLAASLPAQYFNPGWFGTHDMVWVVNPNTVAKDANDPFLTRCEFTADISPAAGFYNPYAWDTKVVVSPDANVSIIAGMVNIYFGLNPSPPYRPLTIPITTLKVYTFDVVFTDVNPNPDVVASCRLHVIADPAYAAPLTVYGASGIYNLGFASATGDPSYWIGRYPGGSMYTPPPPSTTGNGSSGGDEGGGCSTGEGAVGLWALAPAGLLLLRRKKRTE